MSSTIVKIAEAVKAELNVGVSASQFGQTFKATRRAIRRSSAR